MIQGVRWEIEAKTPSQRSLLVLHWALRELVAQSTSATMAIRCCCGTQEAIVLTGKVNVLG